MSTLFFSQCYFQNIDKIFLLSESSLLRVLIMGERDYLTPSCFGASAYLLHYYHAQVVASRWYGLIIHFCDSNHEITRMQQEEIQ